MGHKSDKFTKYAVRVVVGVFALVGLGGLLLKGIVINQGPGEERFTEGNVTEALTYVVICVVGGLLWAGYKSLSRGTPKDASDDDF